MAEEKKISLFTLLQSADVTQIEEMDENQNTPLLIAAKRGFFVGVVLLVNAGADLNQANKYGVTAAMLAIQYNHFNVFSYLLAQGYNLLLRSDTGNNVLRWSVVYARLDMLALLPIAPSTLEAVIVMII